MRELSLNVLDIAQNSIQAAATCITVAVTADTDADRLTIVIADNGCGMDRQQLKQVQDPFYTTRTTRKIGMGVPLFRMAAQMAGGRFHITSAPSAGTKITAEFQLSHINRPPMGDMAGTITALIQMNPALDVIYRVTADNASFELDTQTIRQQLEDVPLNHPDVLDWVQRYISEHSPAIG